MSLLLALSISSVLIPDQNKKNQRPQIRNFLFEIAFGCCHFHAQVSFLLRDFQEKMLKGKERSAYLWFAISLLLLVQHTDVNGFGTALPLFLTLVYAYPC